MRNGGELSARCARNSLIWHHFVSSYLLWRAAAIRRVVLEHGLPTRMPQTMHSYYLREMYLNNNLVKRDALTIAGERDRPRPHRPTTLCRYRRDDHIAPWRQCYRIRKYVNVSAPVRFVLSSSGHILASSDPPVTPTKADFRVGEPERNEHFEHWQSPEEKPGSWWEDWGLAAAAVRPDGRSGCRRQQNPIRRSSPAPGTTTSGKNSGLPARTTGRGGRVLGVLSGGAGGGALIFVNAASGMRR